MCVAAAGSLSIWAAVVLARQLMVVCHYLIQFTLLQLLLEKEKQKGQFSFASVVPADANSIWPENKMLTNFVTRSKISRKVDDCSFRDHVVFYFLCKCPAFIFNNLIFKSLQDNCCSWSSSFLPSNRQAKLIVSYFQLIALSPLSGSRLPFSLSPLCSN